MENPPKRPLEYKPPKITKVKKMTFPLELIRKNGENKGRPITCPQCSSCHGCR